MIEQIRLMKHTQEVNVMIKFLTECQYSGSYETKLDLGQVMKLLQNQLFMINELNKENIKLQDKIKILENEKCQS